MNEAVTGQYQRSFIASLKLSFVTALLGGLIGVLLAYAAATLRRPKWLRSGVTAFSGVAANFGGIPLAFAFIAALGTQGLMTKILKTGGLDLQAHGFTIRSFWGLVIVYLYFQIPLMVLVTFPAIDGLKPAWREAAANLGAYVVDVLAPRRDPCPDAGHPRRASCCSSPTRSARTPPPMRSLGDRRTSSRSRSASSSRATPSRERASSATRWQPG